VIAPGNFLNRVIIHIADQLAVGRPVDATSTTVARREPWSAFRNLACPSAVTMMSACVVNAPMSRVLLWHTVTVALARRPLLHKHQRQRFADDVLRPTITTCCPSMRMVVPHQNLLHPERSARQETRRAVVSKPRLSGPKPSTS